MASTYTANTGIELIANGEQSGTWGDTTNVNLEIIDRLTNGVGSITLSGTTHTLVTTDGELSDGQFKVLVFGGSPSGTNTVTISPNDQDKQYFVKNSSGQSVVLTQGSGGNVTIANGKSAIVFADGAGAGAAVVDLTSTFVPVGVLLTANNLSDLADAPTALTNLGLTATAAELNTLDGITATTAELNLLDGVTATTAEINILDGVTATTAELNLLDGVTATTAELNLLDGVTATTAELNFVDITTLGTSEANKVLTADAGGKVFVNGAQRSNIVAMAGTEIDCSAGNYFTKTISANTTFSFTNVPAGTSFALTLELTQTSGAVTWPASVKFSRDETPILTAGKTHVFVFITDDGGTRFRGAALINYTN